MFVEWFNEKEGKMNLSKMVWWKAIVTHLSGFGKIIPKSKITVDK